jgi:hypothetical protein
MKLFALKTKLAQMHNRTKSTKELCFWLGALERKTSSFTTTLPTIRRALIEPRATWSPHFAALTPSPYEELSGANFD